MHDGGGLLLCEFEGVGRIPDENQPSIGTGHEWLIYCRDHTPSAVIQFRLTQPKPSLAYGVNRNLSTVIGSTEQSRYRVDRRCDWRNPAAGSGIRAVKRPPRSTCQSAPSAIATVPADLADDPATSPVAAPYPTRGCNSPSKPSAALARGQGQTQYGSRYFRLPVCLLQRIKCSYF